MAATLTDVKNGSVTPNVTICLSFGSGFVSQSISSPLNAKQNGNAISIAPIAMKRRARSSPRCSTSVASSPWSRRRGSRFHAMARRVLDGVVLARRRARRSRGHGALGGARRDDLAIVVVVVLAADRLLELAHPAAERAAHLGQPLRAEDQQRGEQDDEQLGDSDSKRHEASRVAPSRPRRRSRSVPLHNCTFVPTCPS